MPCCAYRFRQTGIETLALHREDKPSRISQTNTMSWAHLNPPRMTTYVSSSTALSWNAKSFIPSHAQIHFACDIYKGKCAQNLREIDIAARKMSPGVPPIPPRPKPDSTMYPLASSCAGCQEDITSRANLSHCGGCKLTRFVLDPSES